MTEFKNIKFTGADIVKLAGFIAMTCSMWYDLKTDQIKTQEQLKFQQYQIDELKRTCQVYAVKPKEIKIEHE